MPTYPTYKLGEICELLNGYAFKSSKYVQSGLRVIRITNVKKGYVIDEEPQFYPIETQEELTKYILKKDDLLISLTGNVGRVGILGEALLPAALNQRVGCLRIKDKSVVYLQYLYHLLNTNSFEKDCINSSRGIAQKNMSTEWLKDYEVSLPPLPTQHQIVSRIESLFAELNKAVEHLRTAQQQLKTYRQAVLNHWLNNDGGKWETVNIQYFLDKSSKGMITGPFGSALKKSEHQCSGIPVLGIENIGEGSFKMPNKIFVTEEKAKELKGFMVLSEDIIISRSGTVGEICKVPTFMNGALLSTNLIRVRLSLGVISADYFVLLFQCSQIRQQVKNLCKGTTRAFLNQTILNQIEFPLPPLPDQQRIVQEIESRLSQASTSSAYIENALQQSEALRQSILKKAFSGELVVSTSSTTSKGG